MLVLVLWSDICPALGGDFSGSTTLNYIEIIAENLAYV
jgi:hypothetical protein